VADAAAVTRTQDETGAGSGYSLALRLLRCAPLLFAACVAKPPVILRCTDGEARAWSIAEAQETCDLIDELAPTVRTWLGENIDAPPRIDRMPRSENGWDGTVYPDRILLGPLPEADLRFVIAHELVHWYAAGSWNLLPHLVEEGLATTIALRLAPERSDLRRIAYHWYVRWALEGRTPPFDLDFAFSLTGASWETLEGDPRVMSLYGLGLVVAEWIGVDRLHQMCLDAQRHGLARVPTGELLRAAGIDPDDLHAMEARLEPWPTLEPGRRKSYPVLALPEKGTQRKR